MGVDVLDVVVAILCLLLSPNDDDDGPTIPKAATDASERLRSSTDCKYLTIALLNDFVLFLR